MPEQEKLYTTGNKWKCGCVCKFPSKKEDVENTTCPACTIKEHSNNQPAN